MRLTITILIIISKIHKDGVSRQDKTHLTFAIKVHISRFIFISLILVIHKEV